MYYKWTWIRYYYRDEIFKRTIVTHWQYVTKINFNIFNFYFLIYNFYNSNINSIVFNTLKLKYINEIAFENDIESLPAIFNQFEVKENFLKDFSYLKRSTFVNFFINSMVDVPICFKKSHSLKNKNFELPVLKFSNYLMKKGKREKIFSFLFKAIRFFFKKLKLEKIIINEDTHSWLNLYWFIDNILWSYQLRIKAHWHFNFEEILNLVYNNFIYNSEKFISTKFFIKNYLMIFMSKISPIFSYFIYNVDKNIRKFSRGKSGKYIFIWKYVAPYKRLFLVMKWIIKDIKFFQSRKLSERLEKTFFNLVTTPYDNFAWKSKIFAHNYVFKNFKRSLMSSLKTLS